MPPPSDVTVVIPVKDRTDGLARLLAALDAAIGVHDSKPRPHRPCLQRGPRVIVVDDGSADPAAVAGGAAHAGAAVLRHPSPRGPAAARNAGLAAATTPLVAFLDSDVVPEPGWLDPLLAHLADPAVGLVAPRIVALPAGHAAGSAATRPCGPRWTSARTRPLVVPRSRVAYVPSAALLVRRAAVGAGFDDDMHVAEDVDLVLRLHAAGWRLRYEPAAAGRARPPHRRCARGGCARRTTGRAPPRSPCATAARCRRWC